jgi:rRNA maturation RNase YbeY
MSLDIRITARHTGPVLPYEKIATAILGSKYELSLVLCGDKLSQQMNLKYRKKTYYPNVLSFPYSAREGEIFLNIRKAEREAAHYKVPLKQRLALLFVHGCFHLKGLDHGLTMERREREVLRNFGFSSRD